MNLVELTRKNLDVQKSILQKLISRISERKSVAISNTSESDREKLVTVLNFYELLRENVISEFNELDKASNLAISQYTKYLDMFSATTRQPGLASAIHDEILKRIELQFQIWNVVVKFSDEMLS